MINYVINR